MAHQNTQSRSIEDLCSVGGHRAQPVPPLPPTSNPNFIEIQKVYDSFFASGLDHLLETGPTHFYSTKGFALLASDRSLLAQFMLYLTLISNTTSHLQNVSTSAAVGNGHGPEQAALASQEARMVWSFLNLCIRPAQEDGDEEAEKLARRVKSIEALLTGEPIVRTGSMSDFLHQEPDPEPDQTGDTEMTNPNAGLVQYGPQPFEPKPFTRQLVSRSDEFWKLVERAAEKPAAISPELIDETRQLLDGMENRDVIYSLMILGGSPHLSVQHTATSSIPPGSHQQQLSSSSISGSASGTHRHNTNNSSNSTSASNSAASSPHRQSQRRQGKEKEQAARLLEVEAGGRATNLVLGTLAGMGLRAFVF